MLKKKSYLELEDNEDNVWLLFFGLFVLGGGGKFKEIMRPKM